jgi:RNA polymerase sigma-70 factor (ECF subfamily)
MHRLDADTTSPTLLSRLGNWQDREAWVDFVARYDRVIRSSCRRFRLDADLTDELCQRVWIDLARRMRTFQYDPGKTFRGWLRRLCRSRAIDLLRNEKSRARERGSWDLVATIDRADEDLEDERDTERPALLAWAQDVQDAVRRRVDERTWRVFWDVAIQGRSIRETSQAVGMSYAAAFAARKRVGRLLREEGQRVLAARSERLRRMEGSPTD